MANFDHQTLEHLKKLCRIECSPEENQAILESLSRLLEHMTELDEVNTDDVRTCRYVLRGMSGSPLREDEANDLLPREKFLANAPDQIGGMIRVPPILKPSS